MVFTFYYQADLADLWLLGRDRYVSRHGARRRNHRYAFPKV